MSDNTPENPATPAVPPPYGAPAQPGAAQPAAYPPPAYGTPPQPPQYAAPQPPQYGQPQYPQAAYGAPQQPYGAYATGPKTNVLAVISMIASIAGAIWILPFVGSLAGAIMGHIALKQIATTGEKGRGMALAGVIVGWVGLGLIVLATIAFFLFFIGVAASSSEFGYS